MSTSTGLECNSAGSGCTCCIDGMCKPLSDCTLSPGKSQSTEGSKGLDTTVLVIIVFCTVAGLVLSYIIIVLVCKYMGKRSGNKLSRSRIEPISSARQHGSRTPRVATQNIASGSLESRDRDRQTAATANRAPTITRELESPVIKRRQVTGTPESQIPLSNPYSSTLEEFFIPDFDNEPILNIASDMKPAPKLLGQKKLISSLHRPKTSPKKPMPKDSDNKPAEESSAQGSGVRNLLVIKSGHGVNSQTNLSHHLLDKKSPNNRSPRPSAPRRREPEGSFGCSVGKFK